MKPHSLSKLVVVLAASAMGMSALAQTSAEPAPAAPAPAWKPVPVGKKAPDFKVYTTDGQKTKLSDLKGKIVILDFWATWCGPCQVSMPGVEKVYQQVKDNGVVVLSVNTWDADKDFKEWVAKNSGTTYHFNFVRDPAEGDHDGIRKKSIAKRLYHAIGIPTMYVIDRQGNVAGSMIGSGNEETLVKVLGGLGLTATAK